MVPLHVSSLQHLSRALLSELVGKVFELPSSRNVPEAYSWKMRSLSAFVTISRWMVRSCSVVETWA